MGSFLCREAELSVDTQRPYCSDIVPSTMPIRPILTTKGVLVIRYANDIIMASFIRIILARPVSGRGLVKTSPININELRCLNSYIYVYFVNKYIMGRAIIKCM